MNEEATSIRVTRELSKSFQYLKVDFSNGCEKSPFRKHQSNLLHVVVAGVNDVSVTPIDM
jgi:hypothetical protein